MNQIPFTQLELSEELKRAVDAMGFETATQIQSDSIPVIREGRDVIGRSQTGTGKTVAFGIPAIEAVDTMRDKNKAQVLILCPTRELAVQACDEMKKLSKYKPGVKTADIYGGAPMDRQIMKLRSSNIVIGTPGRVMDHMRRRTLKLDHLKMVVLDEADEMLSMGFREDIETILDETPEERQTVLFSATMPPEILALTKKYQKDPKLIEIDRKQVTVKNIEQCFYDVPMGRKMDALNLILKYHNPTRAILFCNTKKMVDDISAYLFQHGFNAEGLHGDMKQSQRQKVMDAFKQGKTAILVATDVAARGIDVTDIDYVINYDIPQNTEYYIHRIGRTGRAGKSGKAITICSGRRQVEVLLRIGRLVKSEIKQQLVPSGDSIFKKKRADVLTTIEEALKNTSDLPYEDTVKELQKRGYSPELIAAAALELHFGKQDSDISEIKQRSYAKDKGGSYQKLVINIGRQNKIAPKHIVGAITERTELCGSDIGKIEIYDDKTVVSVPQPQAEETLSKMKNCKICGVPTVTTLFQTRESRAPRKDAFDYRGPVRKKRNQPIARRTREFQ